MLINQPLAMRFGQTLTREISDPQWNEFNLASAWVRFSGVRHLQEHLIGFLRRGNIFRAIIGLDLQGTTKEGLELLLSMEEHGNSEVHVYHNESSGVFHPKVYLFSNSTHAKLIVGSNNLTESGLYRNVEASLELSALANDQVIMDAVDAFASWRDTSTGLAHRLTGEFLTRLYDNGYIVDEATLVRTQPGRSERDSSGAERTRLFNSVHISVPRRASEQRRRPSDPGAAGFPLMGTEGTVLLMRLRKAHAVNRRTQTQIPKRVIESGFFGGESEVVSSHSSRRHEIHEASARGIINTLKLEIPEMRDFVDPVIRFERTSDGIAYSVFDVGSPQGNQIMRSLEEGRIDNSTHLTMPRNPISATWWRFI